MHTPKSIKYPTKLEWLIAINGGAILVLEIVGARAMAPFFGSSVYVWTAIIGVILASLSVGYWYGGKLADRQASNTGLSSIFMISAGVLAICLFLQPFVLEWLFVAGLPVRLSALLGSLIIYAPPTFFMGLASPYVAKLSIKSLKSSGESVGRIYAAGTIGSIAGTFLSGYVLTGYFTNESINWTIVTIFLVMSVVADRSVLRTKLFVAIVLAIFALNTLRMQVSMSDTVIFQQDTPFGRYQVIETFRGQDKLRLLATDRLSVQSGVLVDRPSEPAFPYIESFVDASKVLGRKPNSVLIIGGGAYTLPIYLRQLFPDVQIDIVEIDAELLNMAETYFGFVKDDGMTNYVQDGRVFLNSNTKKYDLIYIDAFTSYNPPFHLMTQESFEYMKASLAEGGLVVSNVIGSINGQRSLFTASYVATMKSIFKEVAVFRDPSSLDGVSFENIVSIAADGTSLEETSLNPHSENARFTKTEAVIFKDNFAPVERLLGD